MKKDKYDRFLESFRKKIAEEGMVANPPGGSGGFSGSSDPAGPTAGYDPLMKGKPMKRKKYVDRYIDQFRKEYKNNVKKK
jgi:hypothetical protein